ncbi:MAG: ATP-binding protein, partial [Actinomycetota bacterium]|nr:ATP-binding protein [Actinomycetota bacterium]
MEPRTFMSFVGRVAELRHLVDRLERAAAGGGGMVLLSGEPGIGKTALAEHVAGRARSFGFAVAWSACWETAAVPALWPWTQLLGQLAGPGREPPELASEAADADTGRVEQFERVTDWLRHAAPAP